MVDVNVNFVLEEQEPYNAEFTVNPDVTYVADMRVLTGTRDHTELYNRDVANQHPISAITGLEEALAQIPTDYVSDSELEDALLEKQDVIRDLSEIRSGAEKGKTALQSGNNISELTNNVGYITNSALNGYATENWVNGKGYLTEVPSEYVTDSELSSKGYQTASQVENAIVSKNYTTMAEVEAQGYLTEVPSEYATKSYVDNELEEKQDKLTQVQLDAVNSGANNTNIGQIATNTNDIANINTLIPNQASSSNQLADKDFVNSSISTNTANFIGTFNSVADLEAYTGTVTNNDYAFVATTDSAGNTLYDRYKYNADTQQWIFEYELNNSSFTASQWAAINSSATSENIAKISENETAINSHVSNKNNPHEVTKSQVGLGNVDNTSDLNKPISTATQAALNGKQDTINDLATIRSGAALGETSLQPNDNISELTNDAGYITAASLPTVNDGTLTIQANSQTIGTFTANQSGDTTVDITIPDSATWGNITGDIADQTDLQTVLGTKQNLLTSENAGNCIEIVTGSSSGLPAEYQEVEYLDSTGTECIDTGITPTATKLRIVTKFQRLADTRGGDYLGSVTSTTPRAGFRIFNNSNNGNLNIQATIAIEVQSLVTDMFDCDITVIQNTSYSYKINNISRTIQDSTINLTFNKSIILYGFHFGNNITINNIPQRFWGFTVYKEDVLIQNLVPARRKSDGVLGMYDTISGDFLTNAGTGTFIAGQDVEETTKINFVNDAGYITSADLPTVNDGTLTINQNNTTVGSFSANSATNTTVNITVPTDTSDLTNNAGYITGINGSDVINALGYTPYNSNNPEGYITGSDLTPYALNDEVVHNTGTEDIGGSKTFTSAISQNITESSQGRIITTLNDIQVGTSNPQENYMAGIVTKDRDGNEFANINTQYRTDGQVRAYFFVTNPVTGGGQQLGIINSGGVSWGYAPNSDVDGSIITTVSKFKSSNGYFKLGNGLIVQWGGGSVAANASSATITLPTPFTTTNYTPVPVHNGGVYALSISSRTTTSFVVNYSQTSTSIRYFYWQAIGY